MAAIIGDARVYGWAPRSAADAPVALAARKDAATMSFLMEVLGNKNTSTRKVYRETRPKAVTRLPQRKTIRPPVRALVVAVGTEDR